MNLTTIEQSKRLKEWGAPQTLRTKVHGEPMPKEQLPEGYQFKREEYAAYDLESLIGWLGEVRLDCPGDGKFVAYQGHSDDYWEGVGHTPLEAVYVLCLAIHGGGK